MRSMDKRPSKTEVILAVVDLLLLPIFFIGFLLLFSI